MHINHAGSSRGAAFMSRHPCWGHFVTLITSLVHKGRLMWYGGLNANVPPYPRLVISAFLVPTSWGTVWKD